MSAYFARIAKLTNRCDLDGENIEAWLLENGYSEGEVDVEMAYLAYLDTLGDLAIIDEVLESEEETPRPDLSDLRIISGVSKTEDVTPPPDLRMLIGAPLGKNLQPKTNRSGALFKCQISSDKEDCIQVITDGLRHTFDSFDYEDTEGEKGISLKPPGSDEIKEDQWLGVTVKSQKKGGFVTVCAHRYIQSPDLDSHHYGYGLCYILKETLEISEVFEPCKGKPVQSLHLEYAFCQAGTSLAFLEDGFLIVGTPGPLAWKGTIFSREVNDDFFKQDKTIYRGPLETQEVTEKYSYLGMSATGGRFFFENITYASGAPRSKNVGEVLFFDKRTKVEILVFRLRLRGEQFAASFGYEILAVDINNDGYDDLLVGAPFYYEESDVGGAVYIYTNLRNCTKDSCERIKLTGKSESRFGIAMTSIGDINKDGYMDVAIGAPYENNGVVYIYLGSKTGLQDNPSQTIKSKGFRAHGYSLSGGVDMDNNRYPDLLVGSYESDVAILYKTRPIIDIKIKIEGDYNNINASKKGCSADLKNQNNTCFSVKCCFTIKEELGDQSNVKYQIEEVLGKSKVSRVWFHNEEFPDKHSHSRTISRKPGEWRKSNNCHQEIVYIREGVRDILSPIEFNVEYLMEENYVNSPILNKTSFRKFDATFQKDCGGDDVCESILILNSGVVGVEPRSDGSYSLKLGENEELQIEANVTNKKDPAYEAKLFVTYPESISFISLVAGAYDSTDCSLKNSTVICSLGNPFPSSKFSNLKLRFEVLKNANPILKFKILVNSTSKELSNQTSHSFVAILDKIGRFQLTGKRFTTHVFYGADIKGASAMQNFEDIGTRVKHRYEISNVGVWTLQNVKINISWPYQVHSNRRQGKWLLYLESTPLVKEGVCYVDPLNAVNPLRLNSSGVSTDETENATTTSTYTEKPKTRRKREIEELLAVPESLTKGPGKNTKTLDCSSGNARCAYIICLFKKLAKDDQKTIDIYSRFWNSTLAEDYTNVDWVDIQSRADVEVNDNTIQLAGDVISYEVLTTVAYPKIVPPEAGVSFWVILVSVAVGVLLLILLLVILKKIGFFKRKKMHRGKVGESLMANESS